jgi:hypothetical protein
MLGPQDFSIAVKDLLSQLVLGAILRGLFQRLFLLYRTQLTLPLQMALGS